MTKLLFDDINQHEPRNCSRVAEIAFDSGADQLFSYLADDNLKSLAPGVRVKVPFGRANKLKEGFCVSVKDLAGHKSSYKLKAVDSVIDARPLIGPELLDLARWISQYYIAPLGQVLTAMVPAAVKKAIGIKTQKMLYLKFDPSQAEEKLTQIRGRKQKDIVKYLAEKNAFDEKTAVSFDEIISSVKTTRPTIKKFLLTGLAGVKTKKIATSKLPAAPRSMVNRPGEVTLNPDQQKALEALAEFIKAQEFAAALLYGVSDSGKTEVYIRAIEKTLAAGRDAVVILPEIALTSQTVQRFSQRFDSIAVVHSQLTAAQRNFEWQKILSGKSRVVVGARSAVFAPVRNLGLIVVDEEHEPSYKQDTVPRYHGRDVAVKRAQLCGATAILGSATPSLETIYNCKTKPHYKLLTLPHRVMDLPAPTIKVVDMTKQKYEKNKVNLISDQLAEALAQTLAKQQQAIMLLNRRGYSSFVYCPSCSHSLRCRNCDVALTFHKSPKMGPKAPLQDRIPGGFAICHYCLAKTLVPSRCPVCKNKMIMIGQGSQRLEDELARKFPSAKVLRVDSDSMTKNDYYNMLADFDAGKIDILSGTQILAKGLHFPNVTLVGVINADTALWLPDFRANERTYSLISQVAGRAGRSPKGGRVFVQSLMCQNRAIQYAVKGNFDGFVADELSHRKPCQLPPFGRVGLVKLRDESFDKVSAAAAACAKRLNGILQSEALDTVTITGPAPAAIPRLQRQYRMQIIINAPGPGQMGRLFSVFRSAPPVKPNVSVQVDIDPVNLM